MYKVIIIEKAKAPGSGGGGGGPHLINELPKVGELFKSSDGTMGEVISVETENILVDYNEKEIDAVITLEV